MLADTHVALWYMVDDPSLGPGARSSLEQSTQALVSAASVWEIALKRARGRLDVEETLLERMESTGFGWLPVTSQHAWAVSGVTGLPHADPFDRLLVAQAAAENLTFVTADRAILGASITPHVRLVDARL